MKIKTECHYTDNGKYPAEWTAWDDDSYDGPGSPLGSGHTEQEAIADLKEKIGETLLELTDRVLGKQP